MHPIDVDFDVFKELTVRRAAESVTYNDVIRELLGLGAPKVNIQKTSMNAPSSQDWVVKGVRFPVNTDFRATFKGRVFTGRVEGGALVVNGMRYDSPSSAAMAMTELVNGTSTQANGWRFWECRLPNQSSWQLIERFRK